RPGDAQAENRTASGAVSPRARAAHGDEGRGDLRGARSDRAENRSAFQRDPFTRSRQRIRRRVGREKSQELTTSRPVSPTSSSVVSKLQRDAEVVLTKLAHRLLQLILRRRADAHLIGLDGGLHFLQLLILEEFD